MALTICCGKVGIAKGCKFLQVLYCDRDLNTVEQGKAHAFNTPSRKQPWHNCYQVRNFTETCELHRKAGLHTESHS